MTITMAHQVLVPRDVLFRELDGESVLLSLSQEEYYSLDEVGTRMWQALIAAGGSLDAARDALLREYDVEHEVLERDLLRLVSELVERGLLSPRAG